VFTPTHNVTMKIIIPRMSLPPRLDEVRPDQ